MAADGLSLAAAVAGAARLVVEAGLRRSAYERLVAAKAQPPWGFTTARVVVTPASALAA